MSDAEKAAQSHHNTNLAHQVGHRDDAVIMTVGGDPATSRVRPEWFGAVGDGLNDDSLAFTNMMNAFPDLAGFDVQLRGVTYKIASAALYFTRRVNFYGESRNTTVLDFSACATVVNAPYNSHIIVVHSNNISGSSDYENPITLPSGQIGAYGEGSGFHNLSVICNPSVEFGIGVFINVAAPSENVDVLGANFHCFVVAGNTASLSTRGGTVGPTFTRIGGNSNRGYYNEIIGANSINGDGIHVSGSDANANVFVAPNGVGNKGWGVNDISLLGNTFVGGHTSENQYGAWRSQPASANRSTFYTPYTEGAQGGDNPSGVPFEFSRRSAVFGALGVVPPPDAPYLGFENSGLLSPKPITIMPSSESISVQDTRTILGMGSLSLVGRPSTPALNIEDVSSSYMGITHDEVNMILFSRVTNGAINPTRPYLPGGFALSTAHAQNAGTAAPITGLHQKGNVVWNAAPSAGGPIGWICTVGGTPGAWVPFGVAGETQIAAQADSTATTVADLVADFNAFLAKVRAAKGMAE